MAENLQRKRSEKVYAGNDAENGERRETQ